LSGLEVGDLAAALGRADVARLTKIHGVGRKTAERLVLELKDKVKQLSAAGKTTSAAAKADAGAQSDLVSALINLGYKSAQAQSAAEAAASRVGAVAPFEALFKEALKGLRSS
jgi:Holliday junction DNA helicase RuvA